MNDQRTARGSTDCPEMIVFEPFRLDTENLCLWREEERMPLTPKAFDVLRYLVERAGRLVTQDEILEALWPQIYVNREAIRKYILEIRKVLGDRPNQPLFIETFPKRGYQFVGKVTSEFNRQRSGNLTTTGARLSSPHPIPIRLEGSLEKGATRLRQPAAAAEDSTLVDAFQQHAAHQTTLLLAIRRCIEGFHGAPACQPEQASTIVILSDLGRRPVSISNLGDTLVLSNIAAPVVPIREEFPERKEKREMKKSELSQYTKLLETRQTELAQLIRKRDGIVIEKSPDAFDELQHAAEREMAIRNLDRESHLLRDVRAARRRIDEGSFGVCLYCEDEISAKRLTAVPWAAFCIQCQELADQGHNEGGKLGSLVNAA